MIEERAVLAGGCFWGMQDLIRRYDGVISTRVGYAGGDVANATSESVRDSQYFRLHDTNEVVDEELRRKRRDRIRDAQT